MKRALPILMILSLFLYADTVQEQTLEAINRLNTTMDAIKSQNEANNTSVNGVKNAVEAGNEHLEALDKPYSTTVDDMNYQSLHNAASNIENPEPAYTDEESFYTFKGQIRYFIDDILSKIIPVSGQMPLNHAPQDTNWIHASGSTGYGFSSEQIAASNQLSTSFEFGPISLSGITGVNAVNAGGEDNILVQAGLSTPSIGSSPRPFVKVFRNSVLVYSTSAYDTILIPAMKILKVVLSASISAAILAKTYNVLIA